MRDGLPCPAADYEGPATLEILAICPTGYYKVPEEKMNGGRKILRDSAAFQFFEKRRGHAVMSTFTNNGTVFSAGTTDWANGLRGKDPAVEAVTRNLIDRFTA
jgi:hypothetical protein